MGKRLLKNELLSDYLRQYDSPLFVGAYAHSPVVARSRDGRAIVGQMMRQLPPYQSLAQDGPPTSKSRLRRTSPPTSKSRLRRTSPPTLKNELSRGGVVL
jgi:hypothetical protein